MKFNLTNEEKKAMAEQSLASLERNLYREVVSAGLNPETFDVETLAASESPGDMVKYDSLRTILEKISSVTAIIESL